jgi:molecular chaperone GrpE
MADKHKTGKGNNPLNDNEEFDINTDENQSGTSHLNDPLSEEPEEDALKAEIDDLKDKYLRKAAEFDNFKRRAAKERMELIQTAGRDVITQLLDVLDDCDRAQKQLEKSEDDPTIKEGVMLVFNKLRNAMQSRGLKAMDTIGKEFDPDLHEAITEIPAKGPDQQGKIADEIMKGYYLNDKIIRHAKVVVAK